MTAVKVQQGARLLVQAFPVPGLLVRLAYRDLHIAVNGTEEQKKQVGNPALLPRPWEPASCLEGELRQQVWQWLEAVVVWLNRDYAWDVAAMIPTCWPAHPHLVHEIAVVADQRRRAGLAMNSDALEEWHRYCLPAFGERMRNRLKAHCDDDHVSWPGRSRHSQHTSAEDAGGRDALYAADLAALTSRPRRWPSPQPAPRPGPRLGLVDLETGEITTDLSGADGPED